jgi:hypothetical protein
MPASYATIQHADVNGGTAFSFTVAEGWPTPVGEGMEEITRHGIDGLAFRTLGKRSEPFMLRTWRDVADEDDIPTIRDLYGAYRGRLVALKLLRNALPIVFTNVFVRNVRPIETKPTVGGVGGVEASPAALLVDEWELQLTEVS